MRVMVKRVGMVRRGMADRKSGVKKKRGILGKVPPSFLVRPCTRHDL